MSKLLFNGVFNFLETYLRNLGSNPDKVLEILLYIFVGLEVLLIAYFAIKSHFAYEFRLIRAIDKINIYLLNNSYVTESNLIEFNKKMKRVPKTLRYHWQQYMLYRENPPSHYMSSTNCIEKPLKSSSLTYNIKTMKILTVISSVLAVLLTCAATSEFAVTKIFGVIFKILLIPAIVIFLGGVYVILQSARQTANLADLYQTFHIFQRLIDKAATTIPDYVDFEVLFTKKEIAKGIPALNEYLEKRARQEQEELEKARKNAVEHEVYDFGSVDISGSLILDRAMKETEIFLSLRNRLLAEIQQTETEIDTLKKAYDNTQREFQRKMQASKENLDRFRLQQESTTNRIESNYIRKQQDDEIKKQRALEKDNADTTMRFNQDVALLQEEIDKRKTELEERRQYVEKAMLAEYKTYSTKVYKNLTKLVNDREKEERASLASTKESYAQKIVELKEKVEELKFENGELKDKVKSIEGELTVQDKDTRATVIAQATAAPKTNVVEEDFVEQEPVKEEDSSVLDVPQFDWEEIQQLAAEPEQVEEPQTSEAEEVSALKPIDTEEQPIYDEFGGYYDSEGYYRYANGTYYDPQGNFHDEFGGYYDVNGNYFPPAQQPSEEVAQTEQQDEPQQPEEQVVTQNDVEAEQPQEEVVTQIEEDLPAQQVEEEKQEVLSEVEQDQTKVEETSQPSEDQGQETAVGETVAEDVEQKAEEEQQVEEKPKKVGRPKKVEKELPVEQKRSVGRPKKVQEEDKKTESEHKGPGRPKKEVTRGPGRPKKVQSEEKRSVGRPKSEPERKGPGRPKKEIVRGPGRPKKEIVRGPGRPPKKKGPGRPKKS